MRRTALLYVLPAVLIAGSWLQAEQPRGPGSLWIVLLALVPAVVTRLWARAALTCVCALGAASIALDVSLRDARPFDGDRDFAGPVLSRLGSGVLDFWDVAVPFAPGERPEMHGAVLLAVFAFCLAVALALASKRPLVAVAATLAGAAWPATLVPDGNELLRGAGILGASLLILAASGIRPPRAHGHAALAGLAVVVIALAASSSPAVAKDAFLSWKDWDPYTRPDPAVGVEYVWSSNYGGISFPEKKTTVLRIRGPQRPLYWRATTLDAFMGDTWRERFRLVDAPREGIIDLSHQLLPSGAPVSRDDWIRTDVTVVALSDRHLVGAATPVAYDTGSAGPIRIGADGVAVTNGPVPRDASYGVWTYAPQPKPAELAESRPVYPGGLTGVTGYLGLSSSVGAPAFAAANRDGLLEAHFARHLEVAEYRPLYATARRVVGNPRSPYAAAVALEGWFRSGGGFVYDEQPPRAIGAPPLVHFVMRGKRGYCQQYAGAMALMLRFLGVPARVAAGFTSGDYDEDKRTWTVTDHDAHTWVEAWFEGYGWLPFDPTPGRGRLSAAYSAASPGFDAIDTARLLELLGGDRSALDSQAAEQARLSSELRVDRSRGFGGVPNTKTLERGGSLLGALLLIGLGLVGIVATAKLVVRRSRYLTKDPRRVAAACRAELADFVRDQRVDVASSATISELGNAIETELGVESGRFVRAASAARYGPAREAAASARRARRELRLIRRHLRRTLSRGERARGLLSIRSLGFNS